MSTTSLFLGILFGSIGFAFCVYGKRQSALVPLLCGVALMVFPYFVASTALLVVVGAGLVAIPWFVRP